MEMYDTALIVGRAFALANSARPQSADPARDICRLARGDTLTLTLAQERFREFLERRPTEEDRRAFELLGRALALSTTPSDEGRLDRRREPMCA